MEVILNYQPIGPSASLRINGIAGTELYGPLGNVHRYPIQSWLYQRGAWPGLSKVISDLSRGRSMEITFIGRELDYQDVRQALSQLTNVTFHFQNDSNLNASLYSVTELKAILDQIPNRELRAQLYALTEIGLPEEFLYIDDIEAYHAQEDQLLGSCLPVILSANVFHSVQKDLQRKLREHFKRPYESIIVLAKSPQEQSKLQEEWQRYGFSVCMENDPLIELMIKKYSVPTFAGLQLEAQYRLGHALSELESYFESLREENKQLRSMNSNENLTVKQERKYENNRNELRWYRQNQERLDELARTLLGNSIICV